MSDPRKSKDIYRELQKKAPKLVEIKNNLPDGLEVDKDKCQNPDRHTAECLCTAVDLADEGKMDEAVGIAIHHGIVKSADTENTQTCKQRQRDEAELDDDDEATLLGKINASMERIAGDPKRLSKDISKLGPSLRELTRLARDRKYNKNRNRG